MNRLVYFRAKKYRTDEWVYGRINFYDNGPLLVIEPSGKGWCVDAESVGQYTGKKDREGTMVFDGDILESDFDSDGVMMKNYQQVYWSDEQCGFLVDITFKQDRSSGYPLGELDMKEYVVAGNIHDNADLLKGGGS